MSSGYYIIALGLTDDSAPVDDLVRACQNVEARGVIRIDSHSNSDLRLCVFSISANQRASRIDPLIIINGSIVQPSPDIISAIATCSKSITYI